MSKAFRYFRKPIGITGTKDEPDKPIYKYSVYMQSRDSSWLNKNINNKMDEDPEPIEEDIRD